MNRAINLSDSRRQLLSLLPRLRRYALVLALTELRADALVKLAIERALVSLSDRDSNARLDRWVFGILQRAWLEYPETDQGLADLAVEMRATGQRGRSDLEQAMSGVRRAFDLLTTEQRQALFLVSVENFTYSEVADQLGMQPEIVAGHIASGRLALIANTPASGRDLRLSSSKGQ